jgi:uncharacterized alpha-E superfamily protein
MISRVADCCFWLGRYLERAESTARLLQVTASLALDGDLSPRQCWHPVIITAGEEAALVAKHGDGALSDGERVQAHLAIDRDIGVSIVCSIAAARENARSIREVISLEVWESLNELHLFLQSEAAAAAWAENRYELYRRVRTEVQLVLGLLRGTMLHDAPMYFAWLGVLLERTGQTARILDVHHHAFTNVERFGASDTDRAIAVGHWLSLLRACCGFEPFMKIHRGPMTGEAVASFLVFESRFPRAVRYCVLRARETMLGTRPRRSRRCARSRCSIGSTRISCAPMTRRSTPPASTRSSRTWWTPHTRSRRRSPKSSSARRWCRRARRPRARSPRASRRAARSRSVSRSTPAPRVEPKGRVSSLRELVARGARPAE